MLTWAWKLSGYKKPISGARSGYVAVHDAVVTTSESFATATTVFQFPWTAAGKIVPTSVSPPSLVTSTETMRLPTQPEEMNWHLKSRRGRVAAEARPKSAPRRKRQERRRRGAATTPSVLLLLPSPPAIAAPADGGWRDRN